MAPHPAHALPRLSASSKWTPSDEIGRFPHISTGNAVCKCRMVKPTSPLPEAKTTTSPVRLRLWLCALRGIGFISLKLFQGRFGGSKSNRILVHTAFHGSKNSLAPPGTKKRSRGLSGRQHLKTLRLSPRCHPRFPSNMRLNT